jgi:uncharacterized membrane protein YeaQ/YmgE (transglycosylase-associated protein family)
MSEKMPKEGIFSKIKNKTLKTSLEVLASSLVGAIILCVFLLLIGVLNITFNLSGANDLFALLYIPVVCILPLIIGVLSPLALEKIRGDENIEKKLGLISAFLAGLIGSMAASIILMMIGFAFSDQFHPFGSLISSLPFGSGLVAASFVIIFSSSILALIGAGLFIVIITKLEK